jgi:predicted nucleic acid-binding protein
MGLILDTSVLVRAERLKIADPLEGQIIGAHDLIIAATALHLGWAVKTGNEREFRRVDDLKVLSL